MMFSGAARVRFFAAAAVANAVGQTTGLGLLESDRVPTGS